jgi:hypothetical protein
LFKRAYLKLIEQAVSNGELKLAFETKSAIEKFRNVTKVESHLVPPAQGLNFTGSHNVTLTSRIGIIWPLTAYPEILQVQQIINCLPINENFLIRLPHRITKSDLGDNNLDWTFIPHGLSEGEFLSVLSSLDVCILPHREYLLKGSGLAYQLVSKGIPIITHKANAFVRDLQPTPLLITYETATLSVFRELLKRAQNIDLNFRRQESRRISKSVLNSWANFLT